MVKSHEKFRFHCRNWPQMTIIWITDAPRNTGCQTRTWKDFTEDPTKQIRIQKFSRNLRYRRAQTNQTDVFIFGHCICSTFFKWYILSFHSSNVFCHFIILWLLMNQRLAQWKIETPADWTDLKSAVGPTGSGKAPCTTLLTISQ